MSKIESDLHSAAAIDGQLEWVAAIHVNTDNPHAHVALRGVAGAKEYRLPKQYVKFGIRRHAQDLMTKELGHRTKKDAIEARERRDREAARTGGSLKHSFSDDRGFLGRL